METIDIQIENDCYQYKANDDDLLLYNKSYRLPFFIFIGYALLELFNGASNTFRAIPKYFIVSREASYIHLSEKLLITTDAPYKVHYKKKEVFRWLIAIVIPFFLLFSLLALMCGLTLRSIFITPFEVEVLIIVAIILPLTFFLWLMNVKNLKSYLAYRKYLKEKKRVVEDILCK